MDVSFNYNIYDIYYKCCNKVFDILMAFKNVYQQKVALTRFYQALIADEKEINGEERLLIMKALFGEVNTGLVSNSEKSDLDVVINSILKK